MSTGTNEQINIVIANLSDQASRSSLEFFQSAFPLGASWQEGKALTADSLAQLPITGKVVVIYTSFIGALASAAEAGTEPSAAIADWERSSNAVLAFHRNHRRHVFLVASDALAGVPETVCERLAAWTGLSLASSPMGNRTIEMSAPETPDYVRLLGFAAIQAAPSLKRIVEELAAGGYALRNDSITSASIVDSVFVAFQLGLNAVETVPLNEQRIALLAQQIDALKTELEEGKQGQAALQTEAEAFKAVERPHLLKQIGELENGRDQSETQGIFLAQQIGVLETALKESMDRHAADAATALEEREQALRANEQRGEQFVFQIQALQKKFEHEATTRAALEAEIGQLQSDAGASETQKDIFAQKIEALESLLREAIDRQVADQAAAIEEREQALRANEQRVEQFVLQIQALQKKFEHEATRRAALEAEIGQLQSDAGVSETQNVILTQQIEVLENLLRDAINQQVADQAAAIEEREHALRANEQRGEQFVLQIQALQKKFEHEATRRAALEAEIGQLQSEAGESEAQRVSLAQQIEALESSLREAIDRQVADQAAALEEREHALRANQQRGEQFVRQTRALQEKLEHETSARAALKAEVDAFKMDERPSLLKQIEDFKIEKNQICAEQAQSAQDFKQQVEALTSQLLQSQAALKEEEARFAVAQANSVLERQQMLTANEQRGAQFALQNLVMQKKLEQTTITRSELQEEVELLQTTKHMELVLQIEDLRKEQRSLLSAQHVIAGQKDELTKQVSALQIALSQEQAKHVAAQSVDNEKRQQVLAASEKQLVQQLSALRAIQKQSEQRIATLTQEYRQSEENRSRAEEHLQQILVSSSWKVTSPIRSAMRKIAGTQG